MASFEVTNPDAGILAIHAALLPVGAKGKVIMLGGDEHNQAQAGRDRYPANPTNVDNTRLYDVHTKSVTTISSPTTDVFCSGHAFLGDGRLVIGGGTESWEGGGGPGGGHEHEGGQFGGHPACWVFNHRRNSWERIADFNFGNAFGRTGGGRWYPTLVTLPSGNLIAFSGHPSRRSQDWHNNDIPERFRAAVNRWQWVKPLAPITFYPRIHLLPDGSLFICTASSGASQRYNPNTGDFEGDPIPIADSLYHSFDASSVLLPLLPGDGYAARLVMINGLQPIRLNLNDDSPAWHNTGERPAALASKRRHHACSVLLPDGKIFVSGGVSATGAGSDANSVREGELYDPGINWDTNKYKTGQGTWAASAHASVTRNYHSTALLLLDGSVFTAGSSKNGAPGDPAVQGEKRIEIYKPDYFDNTARPDITNAPRSIGYGRNNFVLATPQAGAIRRVALIRNGSVTHAGDFDQRYVACTYEHLGGTNNLRVSYPADPSILPPGYYMLWIVNDAGLPCKLARFIRIGFQTCAIITDRSTFSVLEVAAQPAGNALFHRAFYVVYDGFLPSELGNFSTPPTITFKYAGAGGITVPGMTATLADIEYEDPARPADIPQKVTFVFDVAFSNRNAFDFTQPMREVIIRAAIRQNSCNATINLTKAPNPYMVDGPTSWLSVDLRVFQLKEGQVKATITQRGSGTDFISQLLDRFNMISDHDYHPFRSLRIEQDESSLEMSETVGGVRVFNYAVAKVRYKAPIPIPPANNDARDVRVFFRLFNSAGTAMQYNPATTYRRAGTGTNTIALIGKEGATISSLPFFAAPRVNYTTASMATQTDAKNKRTLPANNATETVAYFGCWLDINRNIPLLPLNPINDGPFPATGRKSIQELLRDVHQCLVAEVYFAGDPTPAGATPSSSDNLSQRNLAVVASDNPGNIATHTVQHTFEIKPSGFKLPAVFLPQNAFVDLPATKLNFTHGRGKQITGPDLLLIHWNNLPKESRITLFIPDALVDDILELETFTRLSPSKILPEDEHTFSFLAADVNYIPIPGGFERNIPGLFTVELPDNVVKGQVFHVLVQQARYYQNAQRIIGSYQLTIPVKTAEQMLPDEMRKLAVLKHIHQAIPATDSWYLIFNKYLKGLSDKIDGLGGDATNVPASPDDRWLNEAQPTSELPEIPTNITEVTNNIKDVIHCLRRNSENIACIKVKKITLDIHFKDSDCC